MIKNNHDIESLQVMLIKMIEDRMLRLKELNIVSLGKDLKMIKNNHDIESLQVMLIKMIEDRMLSEDDYNLITKYLDKLKNDLNKK